MKKKSQHLFGRTDPQVKHERIVLCKHVEPVAEMYRMERGPLVLVSSLTAPQPNGFSSSLSTEFTFLRIQDCVLHLVLYFQSFCFY